MRLVTVFMVAGLVGLAGCGDSTSDSSGTPAGNAVDRAFVAAMIPHHESAVAMAAVAKAEATGGVVKGLAADITRTQTAEITRMKRIDAQLADAGVTVGDLGVDDHAMGMGTGAAALKGATPFDDAFLRAMVPHHEGAITMAKAELARGENAELKQLATAIIAAQQREIDVMQEQLGGGAGDMDAMHSGHG